MRHGAAVAPDVESGDAVESFVSIEIERDDSDARERRCLNSSGQNDAPRKFRDQATQPRHQYITHAAYSYNAWLDNITESSFGRNSGRDANCSDCSTDAEPTGS